MFFNVFTGLGPGGLLIDKNIGDVSRKCLPGSSHGGKGYQGTKLKAGQPYDKENMTSLLGGSGGECVYVIIFFNPVRIFSVALTYHWENAISDFIQPVDERKPGSLKQHDGDAEDNVD